MSKKQTVISHDPPAGPYEVSGSIDIATAETASEEHAKGLASRGEVVSLTLPGSLTIAEVAEVHASLAREISENRELELDVSALEMIDGAGLQLLASLAKGAAQRNARLKWKGSSEALLSAAEQLGIVSLFASDAVAAGRG